MTTVAVKHDFALQCGQHCSAAYLIPTLDLETRTAAEAYAVLREKLGLEQGVDP